MVLQFLAVLEPRDGFSLAPPSSGPGGFSRELGLPLKTRTSESESFSAAVWVVFARLEHLAPAHRHSSLSLAWGQPEGDGPQTCVCLDRVKTAIMTFGLSFMKLNRMNTNKWRVSCLGSVS